MNGLRKPATGGNVITATNLVYQATTKQDANGDYYVDPLHITRMEESYPATS